MMHVLIVTDIFGKTEPLTEFSNEISDSFESLEIVDPYDGRDMEFASESVAYACFQERVGLARYTEVLNGALAGRERARQCLIGFSVGASAVWRVSEGLTGYCRTKAICFYSSQIRKYMKIKPSIAVHVYFAKTEPTYDVDHAIRSLYRTPNVSCSKTGYLHGFMNKKSSNYNEEAYRAYLQLLRENVL